jgi:hypothetical protein
MPIHEKCPEYRVKEYIDDLVQAYFIPLQYDELEFRCRRWELVMHRSISG